MATKFFAHTGKRANDKSDWQPVREHVENVARGAEKLVAAFGPERSAETHLAGLLHDAGKYSKQFQRRLEGKASGVNHWSVGAHIALKQRAVLAALAVQGHHVGLPLYAELCQLPEAAKVDSILAAYEADGVSIPASPPTRWKELLANKSRAALAARMVLSALCDADFIDTEKHFAGGESPRPVAPALEPERALRLVMDEIRAKAGATSASAGVNEVRQAVLRDCLAAAESDDQLFTLTAPTGAGKTLASLAFALQHAVKQNLRRVIVVMPYLSIIEQTADVLHALFDETFGEGYVLEHHSMADRTVLARKDDEGDAEDDVEKTRRLLAQNWDAPIVVTTSVQFFESLFANRPAPCRKLHLIARSVVYFDEAQTFPTSLATATLETLNALMSDYGVTIVFGTATQPAFSSLSGVVAGGWAPREIVTDVPGGFSKMRRTQASWPASADERVSWAAIAGAIETQKQALVVVNLKKHAVALTKAVCERSEGTPISHARLILLRSKKQMGECNCFGERIF